MSEGRILVSVIIPTHNRCDALSLTLEGLSKQDFADGWEAVVINNNSTDETDVIVRKWQECFPVPLRLIHEKMPGPAAARNAGGRATDSDYLIFIDNDILTSPDFISRHYARLQEYPGCWIVGQFPNLSEQESTIFGRYRKQLYPRTPAGAGVRDTDGITGQGTSMPRADFERLGGFDENFFVASGEDRELAMRAIKLGIRILFDPSIIAIHNDWAGTTVRDFCRRQRLYSQTEPLFDSIYGDANPRYEMHLKNSPSGLGTDGLKLYAWKKLKGGLGSSVGQAAIIGLCEFVEKIAPDSRLLWLLYKLAIAGAIYKGYQEGVAILSAARSDSKELKNETAVG